MLLLLPAPVWKLRAQDPGFTMYWASLSGAGGGAGHAGNSAAGPGTVGFACDCCAAAGLLVWAARRQTKNGTRRRRQRAKLAGNCMLLASAVANYCVAKGRTAVLRLLLEDDN